VAGLSKQLVRIVLMGLLALGTMPGGCAGAAASDPPVEYKIKAAFLLNFAKFITWPEQAFTGQEQPFCFCVLGKNPFDGALLPLQSRTVAKHPISIRYMQTTAETGACQVLFISKSEKDRLGSILETMNTLPVVTVSDIPGFAERGGIIEFVLRQGRLSFKINLTEARKHHLRINASLLNLATEVIR